MNRDILEALVLARRQKRPVVLITDLATGKQQVTAATDLAELESLLAEAAQSALTRDVATVLSLPGERHVFVEPHNPPLRLLIIGAVHIAQPLAQMAALINFSVTVIDPRSAFASEERFPGVERRTGWPDEELAALDIDSRTGIVALTHDPKIDDPGLCVALSSRAFYIGALGSRKTQAKRRERLADQGLSIAALARIRGPIGLDIGAATPAEIAVAICAQMVADLRRLECGSS